MSLELAACRGKPLEWFFPEHGQNSAQGKAVCAGCPCRQECLSEALSYPQSDDHGVRGGLTQIERDKLRGGYVRPPRPVMCARCSGSFMGPATGPLPERCPECRVVHRRESNTEAHRRYRERLAS